MMNGDFSPKIILGYIYIFFFTNVLVKNIFVLLADNCKQHFVNLYANL